MKFIVFECERSNKTMHYAKIHKASCGFAREPNHKTASTICHGYFETYYEALDFAKSLNVKRVSECEFCSPRHEISRVRLQRRKP